MNIIRPPPPTPLAGTIEISNAGKASSGLPTLERGAELWVTCRVHNSCRYAGVLAFCFGKLMACRYAFILKLLLPRPEPRGDALLWQHALPLDYCEHSWTTEHYSLHANTVHQTDSMENTINNQQIDNKTFSILVSETLVRYMYEVPGESQPVTGPLYDATTGPLHDATTGPLYDATTGPLHDVTTGPQRT
ncbi:hypothetical protein EMCRGX_G001142 [Ephydatia muelleri]